MALLLKSRETNKQKHGRVLSFPLLDEPQFGWHKSLRRLIVAIVGQYVRVDFVQNVNSDAAIRWGHILIGLFKLRVKLF